MVTVPPSGGFANVGKLDETGDSGPFVAIEDTDESRFESSIFNGGKNGM
jgi:hypothetical protein